MEDANELLALRGQPAYPYNNNLLYPKSNLILGNSGMDPLALTGKWGGNGRIV